MPETLSSSEPWTNCHPDSSSEPGDAATSSRSGSGSGTERLAAGFGGDRRRAAGDIGAGRVGGGGVEREGNGLPLTDSLFISSTMAGGVGAAVGLGGGPPPDSLVGVAYTCIDRGGLGAEVGFGGGGGRDVGVVASPDNGRTCRGIGSGVPGMAYGERAVPRARPGCTSYLPKQKPKPKNSSVSSLTFATAEKEKVGNQKNRETHGKYGGTIRSHGIRSTRVQLMIGRGRMGSESMFVYIYYGSFL